MAIANSSKVVTFQANRELVNDAMEVLKEKKSHSFFSTKIIFKECCRNKWSRFTEWRGIREEVFI